MRVVVAFAAAAASVAHGARALPKRMIMPWACLEVCDSGSDIAAYLHQLDVNASFFTDISYEHYILEPNGVLSTLSNVTNGTAVARALGFGAHPMVISAYIARMRELWANPGPFLAALAAEARTHRYASFQIDFEPDSATEADAVAYASWLVALDAALAGTNTAIIVAYDEWSPLWNYTLLTAVAKSTEAIYFAQMGTYNGNITFFNSRLAHAVAAFGGAVDRLIIGLETVVDDGPDEGKPYTAALLEPRFRALVAAGVTRIGLWDLPVTDAWWPFLSAFLGGGSSGEAAGGAGGGGSPPSTNALRRGDSSSLHRRQRAAAAVAA